MSHRVRRPLPGLLAFGFLTVLGPELQAQLRYRVVEIGGLPGSRTSLGKRINGNGDILGLSDQLHPFVFSPVTSTVTAIGKPPWTGTSGFSAQDINDRGQVVGEFHSSKGSGFALYTPGKPWIDLGRLTPSIPPAGAAWAIDNTGVVVGAARARATGIEAFRWTRATGIKSLTPGVDGLLRDINDLGQGIGRRNNQWVYWNGQFHALGFEPLRIAAKGLVAGRTLATKELVLYRHGVRTRKFRTPAAAYTGYRPSGVNEAGVIVGNWHYRRHSSTKQGAFLNDPVKGYAQGPALDALVTAGWSIDALFDINEVGQIVGVGYTAKNRLRRAVRLDPVGHIQAGGSLYGTGCYRVFASFYEAFGSFDLQGKGPGSTSIRMTPAGSGYQVATGSNGWFHSTSKNLASKRDSITAALALPFLFRHPGGSTRSVRMCSEGYLWLDGTTAVIDANASPARLVSQAARLCPFWTDLWWGFGASGTMQFDVDPGGKAVYFTWFGVQHAALPASNRNDVQCVIRSDSSVEFRWRRAVSALPSWTRLIVGYSPGGAATLPPSTDLSTSLPFRTGPDARALGFRPTSRPVLGRTLTLQIRDAPKLPAPGMVWFGATKHARGLDLAAIGMPGCRQYGSLDVMVGVAITNSSFQLSAPVPNVRSLVGLHVYAQAMALSSGSNALGIVASNGVDLRLGD
ncbi:MAG: hypothetical protein ACE5F1_07645 [Planctomycetota bacterium]